ncbi:MAG: hypothetical protein ACHQ50_12495 [Fimbriimonadales bacterium]
MRQSVDRSGTINQSVHFMIEVPSAKADLSFTMSTDKTGRPIRGVSTQTVGAQSNQTVLVFGAKSVKVTKTENGKLSKHTVAIPKGNVADASSLWFISTRPKPGTKVAYLHLDDETLKWSTRSAQYVGDEEVPGTFEKGHHIHHDETGDMWVDDEGLPIRMELTIKGAQMVLLREEILWAPQPREGRASTSRG